MNWNEVWMKNCWRRGDSLVPLATVEGKCDFDPAGISMDCTLRTDARITDTHLKNVYHELAKELAVFMPSTLLTNILSQDI